MEAVISLDYICPREYLINLQWLTDGLGNVSMRIRNAQGHYKGMILRQPNAHAEKC